MNEEKGYVSPRTHQFEEDMRRAREIVAEERKDVDIEVPTIRIEIGERKDVNVEVPTATADSGGNE